MKQKHLMILMSIVALVVSSFMIAGNVGAMYMSDGATQNGTTGGWNTPNDMVCILGVHADGTLDLVSGVTNARDCIYYNTGLAGMDPVDVTAQSVCAATNAGPFTTSCATVANCKFTAPGAAAIWDAAISKCFDQKACIVAGASGNDGAKHSITTSICVDGSGNGISLKDLDRTAQMCAAKGGTWKQTSATPPSGFAGTFPTPGYEGSCVAYGRQFKGQDANGTLSAFGAKGTAAGTDGQGYCYTTMNMTTAYATAAACPSNKAAVAPFDANAAYDWAFASSKCTYAKGIKGYINAALTKSDGTLIAANTYLDLSTVTTMGDCLATGASWNNWVGVAASTTSITTTPLASTIPAWDYTKQAPDADKGCLHCHSTLTQYNGPAERMKDSYLQTGHKNMLRKVTAGMKWAGPDGVVYTTDGAAAPLNTVINFGSAGEPYGHVTVGGVDQNLYYVYGDWMAALPTLIYGKNGYGNAPTGITTDNNGYSCYACHTTGVMDSSLGCTVNPTINTTAALCTAAGGTFTAKLVPGVLSIGTAGYAGVQPQASFPNLLLNANNPKWDLDGINCSRCHNAAVGPVSATQIAASGFTTTQPTGGGMGALTATNNGRTNLCFGCHQSIAKDWPAGTTTTDPTKIPVGVSHGAAAGRDFNGHVLGNSFLNSVHGKFTGTIQLNSLGKFDISGLNGTGGSYASLFKGFSCYQSPSSTSPAKTKDATSAEINNKTTCESLYGAGSWRADNGGSTTDPAYKQGTCSTCHDVHNSLFVASQSEKAIRKGCTECHVDNATTFATDAATPQVVLSAINHPQTPGTPFDTTLYPSSSDSCAVCHMATQAVANGNQNSMPAHVWRINTDANYSTFPSVGQFYGGACSVHTGAVQNAPFVPVVYLSDISSANCIAAAGTWTAATKDRNAQTAPEYNTNGTVQYQNAVWVDVDMACGQCHGGSLGASATVNNAPFMTKTQLAGLAAGMHSAGAPVASFIYTDDPSVSFLVHFDASQSFCPSGDTCVYTWDFGDGSPVTVPATSTSIDKTYVSAFNGTVNLTLIDTTSQATSTFSSIVAATKVNTAPTASFTTSVAGLTVTVTDTSTPGNNGNVTGTVVWGDGSAASTVAQHGQVSHTYGSATSYIIQYSVTDGVMTSTALNQRVTTVLSYVTVSGLVTTSTGTPISGATVYLYNSANTLIKRAVSASNGSYSLTSVASGTYSLRATSSGRTFNNVPVTITNSNVTQNMVANP